MLTRQGQQNRSGRILRRLVKALGYAALVAALIYLSKALIRDFSVVWGLVVQSNVLLGILAVSVPYFFLLSILPFCWLLLTGSHHSLTWREAYSIYGRAQVAKYLPGNVMQLVGRQWLGGQAGIAQADLAMASLLEVIIETSAMALVASSAVPYGLLIPIHIIPPEIFLAGVVMLPIAGFIVLRLVSSNAIANRLPGFTRVLRHVGTGIWATVFVSYVFFWVGFGTLVALLNHFLGGTPVWSESGIVIVGAAAMAALAGLVTPGAPGGLGVREAVFVLTSGGTIGEEQALTVILLFRIVTTIADLVVFTFAFLLARDAPRRH